MLYSQTVFNFMCGFLAQLLALQAVWVNPAWTSGPIWPDSPPAGPEAAGVYEEDFSTYAAKDVAQDVDWDPWRGSLQLAHTDSFNQGAPRLAATPEGDFILAWRDERRGIYESEIMVQKFDPYGNRLWQQDVSLAPAVSGKEQELPALAVDGAGNAIVAWMEWSDVYCQKLSPEGVKRWPANRRLNSTPGSVMRGSQPAVAAGASEFVAAWLHDGEPVNELRAQRFDDDGNAAWAGELRIDSGNLNPSAPLAAMDRIGDTVFAWSARDYNGADIYAQRANAAGCLLWPADLRVNADQVSEDHHSPALAVDAQGNAAIAWQDDRGTQYAHQVYLQKLDVLGNRAWPDDIWASGLPASDLPAGDVDLAADEAGNVAVAWNSGGDAYAQKYIPDGSAAWAEPTRLNAVEDGGRGKRWRPVVAGGAQGSLLAVWEDYRDFDRDLYGQKLDGAGKRLWELDVIFSPRSGIAQQYTPAAAMDAAGNLYLVWSDDRNADEGSGKHKDLYAQKLDPAGNQLWPPSVRVNGPGSSPVFTTIVSHAPATAFDPAGGVWVVWPDRRGGKVDLYAQRLDGNGSRRWAEDRRVNAGCDDGEDRQARVALDPLGNALIAWECYYPNDDHFLRYSEVYVQKFDPAGNRLWSSDVFLERTGRFSVALDVVVDPSGNAVIAWGVFSLYSQKLDPDGQALWPEKVLIHEEGTSGQQLRVGSDGSGNVFVAWETGYSIRGQKLSPSGTRLWPGDRVLVVEGHEIELAASAGKFVLAWEKYEDMDTNVYAQAFDGDGNPIWAEVVCAHAEAATAEQGKPAAAAGALGNYGVAWVDFRNGAVNADVYAQVLNAAGERSWPADAAAVAPDRFTLNVGEARSRPVDQVAEDITRAKLTAEMTENGGQVAFFLSNNGGADWAPVLPGVTHIFATRGSDLRWKAVLRVDPTWLGTPEVEVLRIEYSTDLRAVFLAMMWR